MIKASPHKLWEFYGTDFALGTYPVVPECLQNGVRKYNAQSWGQYVPVVNFIAQKGRRSWEMLPPISVFKVFFKPDLRLTDTSKYFQKKLNYCGYLDLQLFLKCSNHNFAFFAYIWQEPKCSTSMKSYQLCPFTQITAVILLGSITNS